MSDCPVCDRPLKVSDWLSASRTHITCSSCGKRLRPSRPITSLGILMGPAFGILAFSWFMSRGQLPIRLVVMVAASVLGLWILTSFNRFTPDDWRSAFYASMSRSLRVAAWAGGAWPYLSHAIRRVVPTLTRSWHAA